MNNKNETGEEHATLMNRISSASAESEESLYYSLPASAVNAPLPLWVGDKPPDNRTSVLSTGSESFVTPPDHPINPSGVLDAPAPLRNKLKKFAEIYKLHEEDTRPVVRSLR